MDFCQCRARACVLCGGDVDLRAVHLTISPVHHRAPHMPPAQSGPHLVHEVCWQAVVDLGRRAWHARSSGEQDEP